MFLLVAFWVIFFGNLSELNAEPVDHPPQAYELESMEIIGTTRITVEQLKADLRIGDHTKLTDHWILDARTKLMGLGLFKDIFFAMKKGSKPGLAKLVVRMEDDVDVLSDWAFGGEFDLALSDPTPAYGEDSVVQGYRVGFVARNILRESHRAAVLADIDSQGSLVFGQAAYGLPRFIEEAIQFDAAATVAEARVRYFETESYGLKLQSLWTRQRRGFDIVYGAAWYSNTHVKYRLDGWPDIVAGPKVGLVRETRFLGFIPRTGYRVAVAVVPSMIHREDSVLETEVAATYVAWNALGFTATGKAINTGRTAVTTRSEFRVDIPLTTSRGLSSLFYGAVRHGQDHYNDIQLSGTESAMGFRYHSNGFIGDLSFKVVAKQPYPQKALGTTP